MELNDHNISNTHKRKYTALEKEVKLVEFVAKKQWTHIGKDAWIKLQKSENEPIYEKELIAAERNLSSKVEILELRVAKGAYIPPFALFSRMLELYLQKNAIFLDPRKKNQVLDLKVSWDNRSIWN